MIPDERQRRKYQDPESTLLDAGLRSSLTFVDVGCGDGYFALPAARIVGEAGRVYAFDEDPDAIGRLKRKARIEGIGNLDAKIGKAEDTVLCEECADIVFFGIVLHDFEDPAKVLENGKVMLKASGRLVNVDWKKTPMEFGPPLRIRFSEEEAARLIVSAGFKIEILRESGVHHYMITAAKSSSPPLDRVSFLGRQMATTVEAPGNPEPTRNRHPENTKPIIRFVCSCLFMF